MVENRFLVHYSQGHTKEIIDSGGVMKKVREWEKVGHLRLMPELDKDGCLIIKPRRIKHNKT